MSDPIRVEPVGQRKTRRTKRSAAPKRPVFIRLRSLLWLPVIGGLIWGIHAFGTPHLRFAYRYVGAEHSRDYTSCDYVGLHSRRVFPVDGHCPLFVFLRPIEGE